MDDVPEARTIPEDALAAMVGSATPGWELRTAEPTERGFCTVYRVVVARDGSERELYLKASPDGDAWSIPTEARVQAVLSTHTSIPVPEVLAVTDDHDVHPTPHYLMRGLPGEALPYEHVGQLDDDALRRLARETGAHLGELHSVPAVEAFGHVRHDGPALDGDRPSGDPATLTVGEPREEWPAYLRERVEHALGRHADSGFPDLTPELREWFEAGIGDLEGPFEPVLGRNDHGLHNLLVDPATGEVTGVLDWGYTLAVPAAFDFEFAVYLYGGSFLAGLPDVADRRSLVREAMLAGYRTTTPDRADAVATPEPLYEALAMVRVMNDFERLTLSAGTGAAVSDGKGEEVPDDVEAGVVDRIRADVRALVQ